MVETGKQNFMPGIKDKVVVITGANSEKHSPGARHGGQALGRLRARVMALLRRSSRLPGMPDAFDRAPLR